MRRGAKRASLLSQGTPPLTAKKVCVGLLRYYPDLEDLCPDIYALIDDTMRGKLEHHEDFRSRLERILERTA